MDITKYYRQFKNRKEDKLRKALTGKRILITGGSDGIGEELTYAYARYGASVFIVARRENLLKNVIEKAKEMGSDGAKFGYTSADLADKDVIKSVIENAVEVLGGLDQLILNHGCYDKPIVWTGDDECLNQLRLNLEVNLVSSALLASCAHPYLKETHGCIAVVGSLLGKLPSVALQTCYAASKFALDGFFGSLRLDPEYANISITYCVIASTDTNRIRRFWDDMGDIIGKGKADALFKVFPPGSVVSCAQEILRGTTYRCEEIYFPPEVTNAISYMTRIRQYIVRKRSKAAQHSIANIENNPNQNTYQNLEEEDIQPQNTITGGIEKTIEVK